MLAGNNMFSGNSPSRLFVHVLVYVNQNRNFRVDPNYFSVPFLA